MRTAGEILSEKRKELGRSLEDIEKETKIRKKYLEAIEKSVFSSLPESTTVKGFIRNYSQSLGLIPESVLAVFRRDFKENQRGQIIPRGMMEPLDERSFYWTPKATIISLAILLITGFGFLISRQYFLLSAAPPLEIYSPKEGQIFKEKVEVSGKTDKDASLKIDGTLITISDEGKFKEEVVLPRGDNVLTIEAANRQGKKRVVERRITVE